MTCSIIGSFRKYYAEVKEIIDTLVINGIIVLSPKASSIVDPNVEFVIFESDNPNHSAQEIQLIALHRILRSDFVYVCNPNGYIGRTTCYEIGRIVERQIPIFFMEKPHDLPIYYKENQVISITNLIATISQNESIPSFQIANNSFVDRLNSNLINNKFYE